MKFADIKNDIAFRKIFGNEQKTAFIEADKYQWSKEELKAYDNVSIKEQDERGEKELVAQKAKEEGKDEKEAETVIKLHLKGKSDEEIADLLDIPVERVKEMIKQYYDNNK